MTGAEFLVRGASRLATSLGVPSIIVGLTVVSIGTSAPELVVTVRSALAGSPELAVGNVVGSNIFNVLVILGLSAMIVPLVVSRRLIRRDVPLLIGVSFLVMFLARDGILSMGEGIVLMTGAALYLGQLVRSAVHSGAMRDDTPEGLRERPRPTPLMVARDLAFVAGGLVGLVVGASWLVEGSVIVARALGVSELIIGLTLIAGGTSLPEVAASVVAAIRGERDLAVGNVVGSNLFNLLIVLGAGAAIAPGGIPVTEAVRGFDLPIMTAVAVACLPIFMTGARIDRWEGGVFLAYYAAYLAFIFLDAVGHDALPLFSGAMLLFVLPLTGLTLAVVVFRELRDRAADRTRGE